MTTKDAAEVIASCSFCKKNNTQVKKLIAGPGVYICDECVTLCDGIVGEETSPDDAVQRRAEFVGRSAEELLRILPGMAATAAEVEADVRRWVDRILATGGTWHQIAVSLGVSEQSARTRFSDETA